MTRPWGASDSCHRRRTYWVGGGRTSCRQGPALRRTGSGLGWAPPDSGVTCRSFALALNVDPVARGLLLRDGWTEPDGDTLPTAPRS